MKNEAADAITEETFRSLKREWKSSPVFLFLTRHALCVGDNRDPGVLAWLEPDGLRCWCRYHGDTIDVPDTDLAISCDIHGVLCAGVATEHPHLFRNDPSGTTLGDCVNRLVMVLRRAALLFTAGRDGAPVH